MSEVEAQRRGDAVSEKLFGTDGVRGRAGRHPLTAAAMLTLGRAAATTLAAVDSASCKIVIGKDTRASGDVLEAALAAGICASGVDVVLAGVLPTPGVAALTRELGAAAGAVLSASHNPWADNGVKFFAADGFKLPDDTEAEIEKAFRRLSSDGGDDVDEPGRVTTLDDATERYALHAAAVLPAGRPLAGRRIVVDCAHGAGYRVAPLVLERLGANVDAMATTPDGRNINAGVGALHTEALSQRVREAGADFGVALDGDADRAILVDETGTVVDGDRVLGILADDLNERGALPHSTVVATVMSNLGLEKSLADKGITLERAAVGDRYVVERMRAGGFRLGGEQSGHVIAFDYGTTGDGLVTALAVLSVLVRRDVELSTLAHAFEPYPQRLVGVRVTHKPKLEGLPGVQAAIAAAEAELADRGRVLVRYSGTEALARVMVEGEDAGLVDRSVERIADAVREALA